ncbi:ENR1 protein, partial [Crotophaga sulcirostris]|nr:ENR1 protein [Crotophaga sulcirostris]
TNTTDEGIFNCSGKNPFQGLPGIRKFWKHPDNTSKNWWKSPDGLFWICGKRAYSKLPGDWKGRCTLGIIHPVFFLLPLDKGNDLGIPL